MTSGALEGVRVLVLAADVLAVEPLMAALEDAGAEALMRAAAQSAHSAVGTFPPTLDAVIVHGRLSAADFAALGSLFAAVPGTTPVLDAADDPETTLYALEEALTALALPPREPETLPRPQGLRLMRAALTVVAVSVVLWLLFTRGPFQDRPPAGAPTPLPAGVAGGVGGGPAQQAQTGTAELAGRVTRSDTNGSIGGATVVASGPSGPVATITDAQGRWRFTGLRGGRYVVMSTVPSFVAKQLQVEVPDGRAVENVNLSLDPER